MKKFLIIMLFIVGSVYSLNGQSERSIINKEINTASICFTVKGVNFVMKIVEGGSFNMGSDENDANEWEIPVHSVTVGSYYICETEVTQSLWKAVMGNNPSLFKNDNAPVEMVSWNDCQEFLLKLNHLTGKNFRLPTEAEWEYAARGGKNSNDNKYSGSNDVDKVSWYWKNSGDKYLDGEDLDIVIERDGEFITDVDRLLNNNCRPRTVKTKCPNELGIYDMSGNVWEWCSDWFGDYSKDSHINPQGPENGFYHTVRGGSWINLAWNSRVSSRLYGFPDTKDCGYGFRFCLPLQKE